MYEVKLDGYRALLLKDADHVQLRSRNDKTLAYPAVVAAGKRIQGESVVLDGEIVAVDEHGRPSFQALQHRSVHQAYAIVYYAFDVLHLNGRDLTRLPLSERRAHLPAIVKGSGILISQELPGTAAQVVAAVQRLGLEGVIAKRKDSRYDAGQRSGMGETEARAAAGVRDWWVSARKLRRGRVARGGTTTARRSSVRAKSALGSRRTSGVKSSRR
jgi:bifunctional non-homologous end joining protein LigD